MKLNRDLFDRIVALGALIAIVALYNLAVYGLIVLLWIISR